MAMLTRDQLLREIEARRLHDRRLLAALPSLPTIQVDPDLPEAADLSGLCFAFWEGHEHRDPPALLALALDPAKLPTDRWLFERPANAPKSTLINATLVRTVARLGRSVEMGRHLMASLRPFGIKRDERTYIRDRPPSLSALQEHTAEALARCLCQLFGPNPPSAPIHFQRYPLGCAENPSRPRTAVCYCVRHERRYASRLAA